MPGRRRKLPAVRSADPMFNRRGVTIYRGKYGAKLIMGKKRKNQMATVVTKKVRELSELIPDRLRVPMRWHDLYVMTYTQPGAQTKQYAWYLNSPYDPDQPVGVGQKSAYGFSVLATLYARYRCFGSKIKLKIATQESGGGSEILCSLYPSDILITPTSDPTAKAAAEKPYAKSCFISNTNSNAISRIKHYASVKKLEGISSVEFEDSFAGDATHNPADVFFWNFQFDSVNGASGSYAITVDAEIVYYVEWFSRNNLAP